MAAALPRSLAETGRRDSSSSRKGTSHGRGGAGNMSTTGEVPAISAETLETPTLKNEMYTTGRGGSGNMAKNTDAAAARKAQDVTSAPRRESASNVHVGRGGGGNVFKLSADEIAAAKKNNSEWENAAGDVEDRKRDGSQSPKGLADRGKDFLRSLGIKKN